MKYYFILILVFTCNLLRADEEQNLSTPFNTVYTHLEYLQDYNYKPEISANAFNIKDKRKARDLAIQLKRYLDAKGMFVDMDRLPRVNDYYDSLRAKNVFRLFENNKDIYVEKINNEWYYSNHTENLIPEFYKTIFPPGFQTLLQKMPEFMFKKFLGVELWKLVGLLLYLIVASLIYIIINGIIKKYFLKILEKINKEILFKETLSKASGPTSLLIVIIILNNFIPYLQLSIDISKFINATVNVMYPVLSTIIVYRTTDIISSIFEKIAEKTETTTDDQLVPLVRKSIKVVVVLIGSFYIVDSTGVDYTPLLAGVSIGGLALALAAQDTIKNFFGSITIFTDKPFDLGDWIVFSGVEGTVEEVGVRSTRVRTFYNSLVSIPNGRISDMTIDNMGRRRYRRYLTRLNLRFDNPIDKANEFVEKLRELVLIQDRTRKDYFEIHINDITDSSIQILVYIFFEVPNWSEELKGRQEFIVGMMTIAESLKIKFAYPTQIVKLEEDYKQIISKKEELNG